MFAYEYLLPSSIAAPFWCHLQQSGQCEYRAEHRWHSKDVFEYHGPQQIIFSDPRRHGFCGWCLLMGSICCGSPCWKYSHLLYREASRKDGATGRSLIRVPIAQSIKKIFERRGDFEGRVGMELSLKRVHVCSIDGELIGKGPFRFWSHSRLSKESSSKLQYRSSPAKVFLGFQCIFPFAVADTTSYFATST